MTPRNSSLGPVMCAVLEENGCAVSGVMRATLAVMFEVREDGELRYPTPRPIPGTN